jgi:hypothetical protein
MIRVFSLWQPHATLCVAPDPAWQGKRAAKGIETRSWQPKSVLPIAVAIHATQKMDREILEYFAIKRLADAVHRVGYYPGDPRPYVARNISPPLGRNPLPLGAIVGVAVITRVEPTTSIMRRVASDGFTNRLAEERWADEYVLGNYEAGRFGFVLEDAVEFEQPVPFTGRQDVLWDLPADALEACVAQLRHVGRDDWGPLRGAGWREAFVRGAA